MKNLLPSQLCNLFKTSFRLSSCAVFFIFCFLLGWFPASGLIGSIFTSRNRFSTTMSTSSTGSVSTENLIKVLEIPLPFQSKTRENDYDDWQRQEQQRMLNQMFIAQSITSEPAIQVILVSTPTSFTNDDSASSSSIGNVEALVLRYLAEVHSVAWNECIARNRPEVQLHVICEALPGAATLSTVLAQLRTSVEASQLSLLPVSLLLSLCDQLHVSSAVDEAKESLESHWNALEQSLKLSTNNSAGSSTESEEMERLESTRTLTNHPTSVSYWKNAIRGSDYVSLERSVLTLAMKMVNGLRLNEVTFIGADLQSHAYSVSPDSSRNSNSNQSNSKSNNDNNVHFGLRRFEFVAVGGTFDHLHPGHTLLLGIAATLCQNTLTIGVTSQELLSQARKKHDTYVSNYETRVARVSQYLSISFPRLALNIVPLFDSCGPTATEAHLQCLVVSSETLNGAFYVNEVRRSRGIDPLNVVVVPRRDAVLLSSSFIRQQLSMMSPSATTA